MSTIPTACSVYVATSATSATAEINTYSPSITSLLPVKVVKTQIDTDTTFQVTIGGGTNFVGYTVAFNASGTGTNSSLIQLSPGLEFADQFGLGNSIFASRNKITLLSANNIALTTGSYQNGDVYSIALDFTCSSGLGVQVQIVRPLPPRTIGGIVSKSATTISNDPICADCSCLIDDCNPVNVPIVSILSQLTVDYSDVSDTIFIVCDKYQYYEEEKIVCNENKCVIDYVGRDKIKETKFRQCGPELVSVVKGNGTTLREKVLDLYNTNNITIPFDTFYGNLVFYALSKYIFSRLLYGKFNVNYLLEKYNDRFLRDLGRSRFCVATTLYLSCDSAVFGYNQFFLYSSK